MGELVMERVRNAASIALVLGVAIATLSGCAATGPADGTAEEAAGSYLNALAEGRLKDALDLTAAEVQPTESTAIKNASPSVKSMADIEVIEAAPSETGMSVYFRYSIGKKTLKGELPVTSVYLDGEEHWRIAASLPSLDTAVLQEFGTPVVDGKVRNGGVYLVPGIHTVDIDPDSPFIESTGETTATVTMDGSSLADDGPRSMLTDDARLQLGKAVTDAISGCATACLVDEDGGAFATFAGTEPESGSRLFRIDPATQIDTTTLEVDSLRQPTKATLSVPAQVYSGCFFGCAAVTEEDAWKEADVEFTIALTETDIGAVGAAWGY